VTLTSPASAPALTEVPALSVVVPTRNEADNVEQLVTRTAAALEAGPWTWELLLVDDSDDDTPERARALACTGVPVRVLHRPLGERHDGLSGAVSSGFAAARGGMLAVMDADLQHPPEVLPELVSAVVGGADVAVASRYCAGAAPDASDGLDGAWRRWVSLLCRLPVWAVRPGLRSVKDPLAGFFVLRRSVLSGVELRPTGYKILLEVLVRGRWHRTVEVPYRFAPREAGSSKAELKQGLVFLRHVARLAGPRRRVPVT
jgi:glycosyltransferase involved in cell wall biosynthesis